MQVVQIPSYHVRADLIDVAVQALKRGELVGLATDTTWAFCCDPFDRSAVQRLQSLRLRMAGSQAAAKEKVNRPLSLMCGSVRQASLYVLLSQPHFRLMRRVLPGPYTLLLPASREVPRLLRSKRKSVGIRIPDDPVCQALVEALGNPVMTSTARCPEGSLITSAPDIEAHYASDLGVLLESDPIYPEPSTVVDLTGAEPVLIREGRGAIDPSWERA